MGKAQAELAQAVGRIKTGKRRIRAYVCTVFVSEWCNVYLTVFVLNLFADMLGILEERDYVGIQPATVNPSLDTAIYPFILQSQMVLAQIQSQISRYPLVNSLLLQSGRVTKALNEVDGMYSALKDSLQACQKDFCNDPQILQMKMLQDYFHNENLLVQVGMGKGGDKEKVALPGDKQSAAAKSSASAKPAKPQPASSKADGSSKPKTRDVVPAETRAGLAHPEEGGRAAESETLMFPANSSVISDDIKARGDIAHPDFQLLEIIAKSFFSDGFFEVEEDLPAGKGQDAATGRATEGNVTSAPKSSDKGKRQDKSKKEKEKSSKGGKKDVKKEEKASSTNAKNSLVAGGDADGAMSGTPSVADSKKALKRAKSLRTADALAAQSSTRSEFLLGCSLERMQGRYTSCIRMFVL